MTKMKKYYKNESFSAQKIAHYMHESVQSAPCVNLTNPDKWCCRLRSSISEDIYFISLRLWKVPAPMSYFNKFEKGIKFRAECLNTIALRRE